MSKTSKFSATFDPPISADALDLFINPMNWAARRASELGKLYATHDPCSACGHGRLLHKKGAYQDLAIRAADEAMTATQCRSGHFHAQGPKVRTGCDCQKWTGVATPLPSFIK
jgi:hypothetical protein